MLNATIRNQVQLERVKSGEVNQYAAFMRRVDAEIVKSLSGPNITEFGKRRLKQQLAQVNAILSSIHRDYYDQLSGRLTDISEYQSAFETKNISSIGITAATASSNQIRQAVFSRPITVKGVNGGKLLESFIKDWQSSDIKMISNAIRSGYFLGETNQQIIDKIRGTKARRYKDGILDVSYRHANAIVRTAIQHSANQARYAVWESNKSVVSGYRWVSTLDSSTSEICRHLDGEVFMLGKGPVPPAHIGCRSTTIAELKGKFKALQDGRTRSSRGNDGVKAVNDENYYDWLKSQPKSFQDDVLGVTKAKLFRDGGISTDRFRKLQLDKNLRPLTLEEMKQKEPLAFERAKLTAA